MRFRVLLPLLVAGLLAVVAIVIPTGSTLAATRTGELQLQRTAAIHHIAQLAGDAIDESDAADLAQYLTAFAAVYGEAVTVFDGAGDVIAAAGVHATSREKIAMAAGSAARDLPQTTLSTLTPFSPATALLADPVVASGGTVRGAVVLEMNQQPAIADVTTAWRAVVLVGAALLTLLMLAAIRWTNWVLKPVRQLDEAARAFPAQQPTLIADSGPPELRRLVGAFRRMAEGVERTLRQQDEFVADASHQLRTPLTAMRLRVDELRMTSRSEPQSEPALAAVDEDLDRLERTVSRMLDLADAEHRATARRATRENPSRLSHTVPSADVLAEPFRNVMASAGIRLVTCGEREVSPRCPRSDLEMVVATLLENVSHYAGAGATATLRLGEDASGVHLTVSDDGPGLDDGELASVGTRFWRSPRHRSQPGTGLGLAIVAEIARAHDGTVRIDRALEGGLRVTVSLPAEDAQ